MLLFIYLYSINYLLLNSLLLQSILLLTVIITIFLKNTRPPCNGIWILY